jgi:hypothetical protein
MNEGISPHNAISTHLFDRSVADRHLPGWARRGHPVVRRQLGIYWKVMTPDFRAAWHVYLAQVAFILASALFPILFTLLLPILVVPVLLLPFGIYAYAEALYRIGAAAAGSVADDRRSQRMMLLRASPLPLREILAAKGAAAIWRQIEVLDLLLTTAAFLSLPMILIFNTQLMQSGDHGVGSRLLLIAGLTTSLLRLALEPAMLAALGVLMGAVSLARIPAMLATGALGFAYFLLINLPRLAPLDLAARFVVEMLLPLALPLLIIVIALSLAERLLERE